MKVSNLHDRPLSAELDFAPPGAENLIDSLSRLLFMFPPVPGRVDALDVPGIEARITPVSHPMVNFVGCARLEEDEADEKIAALCARYGEKQKAFGWLIGPRDRPRDLPARLVAAGFMKAEEMAGMALSDLDRPMHVDPAIEVREVSSGEICASAPMFAEAYGLPLEVVRLINELMLSSRQRFQARMYLAYLNGGGSPVGFSYLLHLPDQPIAVLGGAATSEKYRHMGIYSSMVARRLADARAQGAKAAIIQAVRSSSAPICRKIGFEELCGFELFVKMP